MEDDVECKEMDRRSKKGSLKREDRTGERSRRSGDDIRRCGGGVRSLVGVGERMGLRRVEVEKLLDEGGGVDRDWNLIWKLDGDEGPRRDIIVGGDREGSRSVKLSGEPADGHLG